MSATQIEMQMQSISRCPSAQLNLIFWWKGFSLGFAEYIKALIPTYTQESELLALKHESRILGHSSNPVCGFSMMEQVRLRVVWPKENWLGSSLYQIQGWLDHCPIILLSCLRARTSAKSPSDNLSIVGTLREGGKVARLPKPDCLASDAQPTSYFFLVLCIRPLFTALHAEKLNSNAMWDPYLYFHSIASWDSSTSAQRSLLQSMRVGFSDSGHPCIWFKEKPSQFSVGQTAQSLTCSIMEKPHTWLDECPKMLLSCFRARNSLCHSLAVKLAPSLSFSSLFSFF